MNFNNREMFEQWLGLGINERAEARDPEQRREEWRFRFFSRPRNFRLPYRYEHDLYRCLEHMTRLNEEERVEAMLDITTYMFLKQRGLNPQITCDEVPEGARIRLLTEEEPPVLIDEDEIEAEDIRVPNAEEINNDPPEIIPDQAPLNMEINNEQNMYVENNEIIEEPVEQLNENLERPNEHDIINLIDDENEIEENWAEQMDRVQNESDQERARRNLRQYADLIEELNDTESSPSDEDEIMSIDSDIEYVPAVDEYFRERETVSNHDLRRNHSPTINDPRPGPSHRRSPSPPWYPQNNRPRQRTPSPPRRPTPRYEGNLETLRAVWADKGLFDRYSETELDDTMKMLLPRLTDYQNYDPNRNIWCSSRDVIRSPQLL